MNSSLRGLAIVLVVPSLTLAGCGGGDGETETSAPSVEQTTETAPEAPPGEEASTGLPEQGATTLTTEQFDAFGAEQNEAALEDDNLTSGVAAEIYRKWADPLAPGECKETLLAAAEAWDRFTAAEVSGNSAKARELGGNLPSYFDAEATCVKQ
jgi:hypothetical protein